MNRIEKGKHWQTGIERVHNRAASVSSWQLFEEANIGFVAICENWQNLKANAVKHSPNLHKVGQKFLPA